MFLVTREDVIGPARLDVYTSGAVIAQNGCTNISLADVQFRKRPTPPASAPESPYPASGLYPSPGLFPGA